ncbi:FAD-binding and (Fe-S)-binding domain-containing protein [Kaistia nematophila]|uniref:FAD-binding and (Fe-S)-binding domain-containing protein n=1 Tax=Kaistia nematophila TaxID=2994654 RepID=A0A9X3IKR3_9HYPH|nr:FAD-binding and (Fe-S)-binding domain-containing protein [Kaistia nematophila]MCX5568085.1 FAD-binding and (Fe-S)-binding domain-containing protein [Kaistia nematophila]
MSRTALAAAPPAVASFTSFDAELRAAGFRGEIAHDHAARAAMSTDNSVYEIEPDLIVAPRDAADVATLLAIADRDEFRRMPITARGGGTGTNGQSLNRGIIVNFQRFMTRILALNEAESWVEVEPGIVLDELNAAIAHTGLFFAPNTSTSNRCTIGGMISTDASGKGSRIYGKTSDNVLGLELVVDGGRVLDSLATPPDWAAPMLEAVAEACDAGRDALIENTPRISRRFTGYDLERARPAPDRLEWWRLPLGAEGTLGLATRIRLKLTPLPRHKRLVVIGFDHFAAALAAGTPLLRHEPLAIEIMDDWVQRLAREAGLMDSLPPAIRGEADDRISYLFVEFVGEDANALDAAVGRLTADAATLPGVIGSYCARDAADSARLWSTRAAAVGLLGKREGARRPVAFVEDCVVPVENLVAFVEGFDAIMKEHGLRYGIYGHIDVGCLHVRPALDLDDKADQATFKAISDAVYALCTRHGGIFWGEHGKGIRGAYLPDYVGPVAYAALQRIKHAFDPQERFNPGKLVTVSRRPIGIVDMPFRQGNAPADLPFEPAFHCNGNASCLNYSKTVPICPSFKATRDLTQSPKGRAEIVRRWRQAEAAGEAERDKIAADAHAALDSCLGCNACGSACPAHVSIPMLKSRFLEAYHATRRRPLRDHAAAAVEALAPFIAATRPLARRLAPLAYRLAAPLLGFVDLPAISARGLGQLGHSVIRHTDAATIASEDKTVLVLEDAFTATFDTAAVAAVCDGLAALGYRPVIVTLPPGSKAAHVKGMRKRFTRLASRQIAALNELEKTGRPMIGVDPAFVLMTRSEFREVAPSVPKVMLVQEFLRQRLTAGDPWPKASSSARAPKLMVHCTEASAAPQALKQWQEVFAAVGLAVRPTQTGCCGMSGLFGHEQRQQAVSRALFDASWAPALADETSVLATGFSCRCQVGRLSETKASHPMAAIAAGLRAA